MLVWFGRLVVAGGGSIFTRLVLIFPLHLEDVKKVGPRGVDPDEVLVLLGDRVGEGRDFELLGTLQTFSKAVHEIEKITDLDVF